MAYSPRQVTRTKITKMKTYAALQSNLVDMRAEPRQPTKAPTLFEPARESEYTNAFLVGTAV